MCCVCSVLGHLVSVHRCARLVCPVAFVVSLATWLLFTGVHAPCSVCAVSLATWLLSRYVRWVCCVACAVFLATWLLFTGVPARGVFLCVRWPKPINSC